MRDLSVHRHILPAIALAAAAAPALAQDPICTDRPNKASAACTVPARRWQVESDLFNYTRNTDAGVRTVTSVFTSPLVKYGLTDRLDVEANWAPYIEGEIRDLSTGAVDKTAGSGDLYLKLKTNLYSSAALSFSLLPYVKAPTAAHGLGNDKWEGGLVGALGSALPFGFSMAWSPEIDWLADGDGSGRHAAYVSALNISHPVSDKLTLAGELWTQVNRDPAGKITQSSVDFAAAYLATPTLQFDAGANFGLNRQTPDTQAYVGVSKRF